MEGSLYFYDLETSGFSPRNQRVMQFAGQRTDLQLNPIGQPHNFLIALSEDILPDPEAILITGITPQQTVDDGITEVEFLKIFSDEIAVPGTIFTGFNSVRFDDEFMRYMHYRNFYDPYEWQWKDGRSKWDILDLVRITRALRPEGMKWPVDSTGKPSNKLTMLTSINGLDHANAHDALSDVSATIILTQLIYSKQPKLFNFMLGMRAKHKVSELVMAGKPFVYTSGKYSSEFEKTTVAMTVMKSKDKQSAVVFDLRYDPADYAKMSASELAEGMKWHKPGSESVVNVPLKTMKFNRCPAVAPLNVLDQATSMRLKIDMQQVEKHAKTLAGMSDFPNKIEKAIEMLDKLQQARLFADDRTVDEQLYDGFYGDNDRRVITKIREATPDELPDFEKSLNDERLKNLLPLYKARNFRNSMTTEERESWDGFKNNRLFAGEADSRLAKYLSKIEELKQQAGMTDKQKYLLTELELYGQSLLPSF